MRTSRDHTAAIEQAVAGKTDALFRALELGSGLPGPKINLQLAIDFANECVSFGPKVDPLLLKLAMLPANEARGASPKEFLSVCGVLALTMRAVKGKDKRARLKAVEMLEAKADDLRFHVRDTVPMCLTMLGVEMGDDLLEMLEPWMDRYFHATAVILALADTKWLDTIPEGDFAQPIDLLQAAWSLYENAPRSAARYPGFKSLLEALEWVPAEFVHRFGAPMFDRLSAWAEGVKMPELRKAIEKNLDDKSVKRWAEEVVRVREALAGSKKPPRDPSRIVHGMRGRGKRVLH